MSKWLRSPFQHSLFTVDGVWSKVSFVYPDNANWFTLTNETHVLSNETDKGGSCARRWTNPSFNLLGDPALVKSQHITGALPRSSWIKLAAQVKAWKMARANNNDKLQPTKTCIMMMLMRTWTSFPSKRVLKEAPTTSRPVGTNIKIRRLLLWSWSIRAVCTM